MDGMTATTAAEVIGVLFNTEVSLVGKIPYKVLEFFERKSIECESREKLISEISQNTYEISLEAKAILSIIYKDYMCDSAEEKQRLNEIFAEGKKEYEKMEQEKYNPFKDVVETPIVNNTIENSNKAEVLALSEKKWYRKIFEKIKLFFS